MIRVLTYNIHGAVGCDKIRDYDRIGKLLKEMNIDIALIQEVDSPPAERSLDDMISRLKSDHFLYSLTASTIDTPQRYLGNAILSRFPISKHTIEQIGVPRRECRNIMETYIETPMGALRALNTHFGLSRRERYTQLKKLNEVLSRDKNTPFIIGGDINEWTPAVRALTELNIGFSAIKTARTFPTRLPIFRLDRMWYSPASLDIAGTVLKNSETRYYSDHYPILAEIVNLS